MKKTILAVSVLLAGAFATSAVAEEGRGSVGVGSYALSIAYSGSTTSTDFAGSALVASYDMNDVVSVAGHYYMLTLDTSSLIEMNGFDVAARIGKNGKGLIYFSEFGIYSETISSPSTSSVTFDYSGGLIGFGIGYNFDSVNITYELAARSTGDYEGNSNSSAVAVNGSLNLAYRF